MYDKYNSWQRLGPTALMFRPDYGEISAHPYGIMKGVVDGNAFAN